ncbi:unnamed protein product [Brassicogethes aeneus]|uniref:Collagen type XV/XVIII trimerization domain-containing protein n=1 Tax=Brassicogethes aeneus TaxID=1431903 RepID=A0A9P0ARZ1_BRAAE|nr:unnamed protein product [Brassicogethes aeneus]
MPGLRIGSKDEDSGDKYGEPTYNLRPGRSTASPPTYEMPQHQALTAHIVPGAVTFKDRDAMLKMSAVSPVGTLAYVIEEQSLLVRVNNGWQYVAMGSLLPVTTAVPPTTSSSQLNPALEASNLVNQQSSPEGQLVSVHFIILINSYR